MATPRRTQVSAPKPETQKPAAKATIGGSAAPPAERIAARAYQIWLSSGCPNGQHEEHWYRAERELKSAK